MALVTLHRFCDLMFLGDKWEVSTRQISRPTVDIQFTANGKKLDALVL
ncbi:hypothetical protein GNE08_01045 [Trichormus variabilis ARAD]|uniref:Transposase n=1 Tax=Trichormus variabilis N2B TaxID=2681315 RepID=A0ABR6S4Z6_ANAVA|nr:hypothetical protein [Trichormus variabilis]MBC1212805.1 hypothetical protein [Trichormus variabilis ARAD]MBC1255516.1 hypothetical protein [Trichormus variabilis V5]MBC1270588.1 hypothetical protein [Trichormus variabilis FSR]MBC1301457.1 hypothetical protein [Trichormus variabilis N2B]